MIPLMRSAMVLTVFLPTGICQADQFQIIDRGTGDYVRDAEVAVAGDIFYTDRYGRVDIDIHPGTYTAQIRFRGEDRNVSLSIADEDYMKRLYIEGR